MMSTWMTVPPPRSAAPTWSARWAKSAERMEGSSSTIFFRVPGTCWTDKSLPGQVYQRWWAGVCCGAVEGWAGLRRWKKIPQQKIPPQGKCEPADERMGKIHFYQEGREMMIGGVSSMYSTRTVLNPVVFAKPSRAAAALVAP